MQEQFVILVTLTVTQHNRIKFQPKTFRRINKTDELQTMYLPQGAKHIED